MRSQRTLLRSVRRRWGRSRGVGAQRLRRLVPSAGGVVGRTARVEPHAGEGVGEVVGGGVHPLLGQEGGGRDGLSTVRGPAREGAEETGQVPGRFGVVGAAPLSRLGVTAVEPTVHLGHQKALEPFPVELGLQVV